MTLPRRGRRGDQPAIAVRYTPGLKRTAKRAVT